MKTSGSKFAKMSLDLPKATKRIEDSLESHHRQAIKAWLKEVLENIPTYTGTARGVFITLAKSIGAASVKRVNPRMPPSDPAAAAKKKWIVGNGRRIKTGFGAVSGVHSISKNNTGTRLEFEFRHSADLFYLLWNDVAQAEIDLFYPTPWMSHAFAASIYEDYIKTQAPKSLAAVKDYIKVETVKVI